MEGEKGVWIKTNYTKLENNKRNFKNVSLIQYLENNNNKNNKQKKLLQSTVVVLN